MKPFCDATRPPWPRRRLPSLRRLRCYRAAAICGLWRTMFAAPRTAAGWRALAGYAAALAPTVMRRIGRIGGIGRPAAAARHRNAPPRQAGRGERSCGRGRYMPSAARDGSGQ